MRLSAALVYFFGLLITLFYNRSEAQSVIRYNQLGYTPGDIKVVVAASKNQQFRLSHYQLKNIKTGQSVFNVVHPSERDYGAYGPFKHSFRINLSTVIQPGEYRLTINDSIKSGIIRIDHNIYKGSADACLRFLRGQRCGFNPIAVDSCHPGKDYSIGASIPDSTITDVSGGWHNAGNPAQEVTTAAIATWYLLAAYQHFPVLFNDGFISNGMAGKNDKPDVLDEAKWGLDWLIKMHPFKDRIYRRVDDTTGAANRNGRPVYAVQENSSADKNETLRITSLLSSAFSLGSLMWNQADANYADRLAERAVNTYQWATQYGLSGQVNTLELAAAQLYELKNDKRYLDDLNNLLAREYSSNNGGDNDDPFHLVNHIYNIEPVNQNCERLKTRIAKVNASAKNNAFMYGLPFTPGSNNLTVSFISQCANYRNNCKDSSFAEQEQANIDWLFGCNPWGVTMISGFPGVSVSNPYGLHPEQGYKSGLVNGPVNPSTYKSSPGTSLLKKDGYADWQSNLAVYHDDAADYTTNEPTIEGTAALVYLLASKENEALKHAPNGLLIQSGAIVRGDSAQKKIALVFLGNQPGNGAKAITQILSKEKLHASFFLSTGYIKHNAGQVKQMKAGGNYISVNGSSVGCFEPGCDSSISRDALINALQENYEALKPFGITTKNAPIFLPYTVKYNGDDLTAWANDLNLKLINYTPGTLSTSDNSLPGTANYVGSDSIFQNVMARARQMPYGINGYFLVFHTDADPRRTDKFYMLLPLLLQELKNEGYKFVRADELLGLKLAGIKKSTVKKARPVNKKHRKR